MSYFQWVSVNRGLIPALLPDQFKEALRFGAKPFEVAQAEFAPLIVCLWRLGAECCCISGLEHLQ